MNCKTKANAGILIALYISNKIGNAEIIPAMILTAASVVGSLMPDIDYTVFMKKNFKFKISNRITKDNVKLHGPLVYLLLYSVLYAVVRDDIWKIIFNGMFIGIFTHLILDGISCCGLPWFYPITKKFVPIGNIKSGGKCEEALRSILIFINITTVLDMMHITTIFRFTQ